MFQNNTAESNHYADEKAIETEKTKCLKSLFTKLENRWLHNDKKSEKHFLVCFFPRSVVSQQTQYSSCFCLWRLAIQPGLKNHAVRPSFSLRCTYLIPIEKTSHNTSQSRIWSFSVLWFPGCYWWVDYNQNTIYYLSKLPTYMPNLCGINTLQW